MLDDHLARAVRWAAGSSRRLAVLFVDLDRFKRINDTLGHVAGDALLVEAAERIVRVVRNSDWVSRGRQAEATVSRFGGDEFIVVLSDLGDPDGAAIVARRLLEAFEAPLVVEGQPLVVTASIGIACHPEDGSEPEALVRRADAAMYQSKQSGRNTFQFFDAEANLRSERALVLERELRMAFERGELRLCYQPVVDTRTGSVRRFEALARWRHPTLGSVRPEEFVRIAEETGMIGLLGRWALEAACIQMREWHAAGFPALSVSVNVSAQQIRRGDLVGDVERVLAVSGLPASALDLEITESTFLENAEIVRDAFAQLRARGVRLTIDDFGTGYSPLAYLRDFPIGSLKIDRRFVEAMGRSERGAALVAAIIALGHRLGMTVVAEGVGDEAQRASLTEEGCDLLQGFGISPPLEADEVAAFLSAKEAAEAR
jgi:diguanylate cyclase (GGDEF)-like protein